MVKGPDHILEYASCRMHPRQDEVPIAYQIYAIQFRDQKLNYRYLSIWHMLWFLREKVN